jgi:SAM-dependent methyltransferase
MPADPKDRGDWREANRARWDELVAIHLAPGGYDLDALRSGQGRLHPIEEAELGDVRGLRLLHLQCHFGKDTLSLAQRGAEVVGLDFSPAAIAAARALADELGLSAHARFVEADFYDAPAAVAERREVRQDDARHLVEAEQMGGEHPAMAGDNAVLFVDQHRVGEAKFAHRSIGIVRITRWLGRDAAGRALRRSCW